jgi:hypothetical protein
MERKFESELAKKVAGGNKDNSSKKKGVLFAAVATCALLFGSAAFSIAEADNDNGNCPVTVKGLLDDEVDELTFVGPDPDVKRTMNLKARSFLPSGDADVEYTKILYSVKVHFNDSEAYTYGGMSVGILTIGYAFSGLVLEEDFITEATVDGYDDGIDQTACVDISGDDLITQVELFLPKLDYTADSEVNFNVSVKLPVGFWSNDDDDDVTEEPWPGVLDDKYEIDVIDWSS